MPEFVCAAVAVLLGFVATAAVGAAAFCCGTLSALCRCFGLPFRPKWLDRIPHIWGRIVGGVYRIFNIRHEIWGDIGAPKPGELIVVVANHPTTLELAPFADALCHFLTCRIVTIGKQEVRRNPFVGWPLAVVGGIIFVDRSSALNTRRSILEEMSRVVGTGDEPVAIIIFPDTRRPSPELIAANRERFRGKIKGLAEWPAHTLVPRIACVATILQVARELHRTLRVVVVGSGLSIPIYTNTDASKLFHNTFNFIADELTPPPHEPAKVRAWLNNLFRQINIQIELWRTASTREDE